METEALEEILRLDTEPPEVEESDLEVILYVMGMLADLRKRSGNFTGKTAEEAYESFIQNYLPEVEVHESHQPKNRGVIRTHSRWLKRITAAAVFAVVVFESITASAFGYDVCYMF